MTYSKTSAYKAGGGIYLSRLYILRLHKSTSCALEVTIVVLIILAGITLNAVIGENGIIFQSKETKNMIANEIEYDNQQLAQLQNELKDNELYSGIGIIPGTDTGGSSEGGEQGNGQTPGGNNQGGSNTNPGGDNNNTSGGQNQNQNQNATVRPSENQKPGDGTIIDGKTDEDPKFYVVSGDEIAASFYQSDVTIQIYTNDRTKKIKYILTTTVPEINNELYPSGLVREIDIENGGTLTFTKDGEYTITAYAYDTAGNKSNPTIMWFRRQIGGSTKEGTTLTITSGNIGKDINNNETGWYTSNVTLRVMGTDTGSSEIRYRIQGTATGTGELGDIEVTGVGKVDTGELKIANGTTFRIVADGEYTIIAYSYGPGGMRLSSSEVLNIKKDATRPTIKSFTGEQVTGEGFKIKISAEDVGSKLTNNAYSYQYRESNSLGKYISSDPTGSAEKMYKGLDQTKTYDMYAMVRDNAGNIAVTDVIARPSLWVSNTITVGETVNGGTEGARVYSRSENIALTFRGQDSDDVGISKTTYQILGTVTKEGSIAGNSVAVGQELTDEYVLGDKETRTIQLQADGNWTVKVHNYNKEGKIVTTNTVEVTRDITPPDITKLEKEILTTGCKVSVTSEFGASGQATGGGFTYITDEKNTLVSMENTNNFTANWALKPINTIKVVTRDKAGNTGEGSISITYRSQTFNYTGNPQIINIPKDTVTVFEIWGAQGGGNGGCGGYSFGTLKLENDAEIYCYVGGTGGWNGGGSGKYNGGGATDLRTVEGNLYSRFLVAGGGGGRSGRENGGGGGGAIGGAGARGGGTVGGGGKQTAGGNGYSAGVFGVGGIGGYRYYYENYYHSGAGGGGWYGGGGAVGDNTYGESGGGGGSGYVYTLETKQNYPNGCLVLDDYLLTNGSTTVSTHTGDGVAAVTHVE